MIDQVFLQNSAPANKRTGTSESLSASVHRSQNSLFQPASRNNSTPARPMHCRRVRLIHNHARPKFLRKRNDRADVRKVAVHAENGFRHNNFSATLGSMRIQSAFQYV